MKSNTKISDILNVLKKETCVSLIIFIVAIILRSVYSWELSETPFFTGLIGDASLFDAWAQEIANGRWAGAHVVLQPFYPYFLALTYFFFGHKLLAVIVVQIIFGALSCVIIQKAGYYFFSRRVGVLAGFLLACYPSAIFFDCLIQKSVFGMFFMSLLLLFLGKLLHNQRTHWWFLVGLVTGLLILIRENAAAIVPVLILWAVIYFKHYSKKRMVTWLTIMLIGLFLVFFPVGLKNKLNTGKFAVGGSHFGPNLYMGNNPKAKGIYVPLAIGRGNIVSELEDITGIAEKAKGKDLTPAEVSEFWVEKTLSYIKSNPVHWIKLLTKKWILVWNATEIGDTVDIYGHAEHSRVLGLFNHICHLGILFPMAVLGICVTWKDRKRLWLLYFISLSYAASLAIFFVFARYRFPMAAVIILFASAGILNLWSFLQQESLKKNALVGGIVMAAIFFSNWQVLPEGISKATTYYNIAKAYEGGGEQNRAIQYYEAALKIIPNFPLAHNNLGIILINSGKTGKAIYHFKQAIFAEPNFVDAHSNLGAALSSIGRISEAKFHLKKALSIKKDDAGIHNNLGIVLFKEGNIKDAFFHFQQAHRLSPDNTDIEKNLEKVAGQLEANENGPDSNSDG